MSEGQRFVIDASIAAKWYLNDEEYQAEADVILRDFQRGRIQLIAPDHLRYEVPSAIRNALRTSRLTREQAQERVTDFLSWRIPTIGSDDLILGGLAHALRFGCSLYDGLYLALAEAAHCPLIYADTRLRNTLADHFPRAVWIGDYPASTA